MTNLIHQGSGIYRPAPQYGMQRIVEEKDLRAIESAFLENDMSKLDPGQRLTLYNQICNSIGLNPYSKPFQYINLSGRLVLYPTSECTKQLGMLYGLSYYQSDSKTEGNLLVVTVVAKTRDGREDFDIGTVDLRVWDNKKSAFREPNPTEMGNLYKKALTQAKRRVTLSLCGLGWLNAQIDNTKPAPAKPGSAPLDVDVAEFDDYSVVEDTDPITSGAVDPDPAPPQMTKTEMQTAIKTAATAAGIPDETLRNELRSHFNVKTSKDLDPEKYNEILDWIHTWELDSAADPVTETAEQPVTQVPF